MKKHGKLILAAGGLVVLSALFVGVYMAARPGTQAGSKTVTVEVVHGDASTKSFTYHTDAEYLGEVLLAEGLIEGEQGDFGLYILVVDGERADYSVDGGWWGLYQQGELTPTGVDMTPIADGDAYQLVYCVG